MIAGVVFGEIIEIIADESHKSKNQSLGWPVQYTLGMARCLYLPKRINAHLMRIDAHKLHQKVKKGSILDQNIVILDSYLLFLLSVDG